MGKAGISVNNWLEEKERFADLFNGVIFEGKQVIQPNELEKISPVASVSTKNRRGKRRNVKKYRDVIMKWKNEIALVLLANESQDKIHYAMPPKVMIYDSLDYEEQMRENWNKVMTKRKADKIQTKPCPRRSWHYHIVLLTRPGSRRGELFHRWHPARSGCDRTS